MHEVYLIGSWMGWFAWIGLVWHVNNDRKHRKSREL